MKIALITDTFYEGKGGVSTAVAALARSLIRRGHTIAIFTAKDPSHENLEFDIKGFRALKYEKFPGGRVPIALTSLVKEISDFAPDIIHNHSMSTMGLQALTASRLLGIPIMGTCHVYLAGVLNYAPIDIEDLPLTKDLAWQYTVTYFNRFPFVAAPSKMMCEKMLEYGQDVPLKFISNGVDIELFTPDPAKREDDDPFTVVHVGRLSYEKKVDVVIQAFAQFQVTNPNSKLLIAGNGPERDKLEDMIIKSGLKDSAEILGFVPHHDLPALFNRSDVFITASPIETQGLVALEAMACGLPCVGVDEMAIPDLVSDGENGFIVDPDDHSAMASRLEVLASNEVVRKRMGQTSRLRAEEHGLDQSAEEYERIYDTLIAKPPTRLLPEIPSTAEIWEYFNEETEDLLDASAEGLWEMFDFTRDLADKYLTPLTDEIRKRMPSFQSFIGNGVSEPDEKDTVE